MKRRAFIGECIIELGDAADATNRGILKCCFGGDTLDSVV